MQKMLKIAAVVGFAVGGIFVFSNGRAEAASSVELVESSRSLYRTHCASCHGNDGRSQTAKGRELEADDITGSGDSVEKISRVIANGKGEMPGFKKKLSAAQISSISRYVKTL